MAAWTHGCLLCSLANNVKYCAAKFYQLWTLRALQVAPVSL